MSLSLQVGCFPHGLKKQCAHIRTEISYFCLQRLLELQKFFEVGTVRQNSAYSMHVSCSWNQSILEQDVFTGETALTLQIELRECLLFPLLGDEALRINDWIQLIGIDDDRFFGSGCHMAKL